MRSRRSRTPLRAWRPLVALTALTLMAGLAVPAAAEGIEPIEAKVAAPGAKVPDFHGVLPYLPEGMSLPTETEPNNDFATANPLGGSQAVILGNISPAAEADYFSFSALAGDRVYAATMTSFSNGGSTDSELTLYASDGTTVIEFDDDNGQYALTSSVIGGATLPADGTYYLAVVGGSATLQILPYHLHVRVQSGLPGLEVEPNNTPAEANVLVGGWATGNITATADPDVFSFTLAAGETAAIMLDMDPERAPANTNWNGRVTLGLFNGVSQPPTNDGGTVKPHAEALFMTVKDAGTYYVTVDSASATGLGPDARYTLSVSVIPKQAQTDCTIIASTDVPVTIGPGVGTVTSTISVPATVTTALNDVNVLVTLNHVAPLDVDVSLSAPSTTTVPLFTDIGTATQPNFDIWLDDNAALPPATPLNVINGVVFQPEQPGRLADFQGEIASGTWTLSITDDVTNASGGTLTAWSLEVCGPTPPPYGLVLTKTVGLEPGACGVSSEINAPPGATVYYCYTATNTGLNTLTTHDLVDDQLGTLFTGVAATIAAGESVSTVDLGLTFSAVIDATTTNNATWTGHDGGNSVAGSASATVNVVSHCAPGETETAVLLTGLEGTFPPAGWAVANTSQTCTPPGVPEWTTTDPGGRGNLTGGSGLFAIADSDRCGSPSTLDTTLTSPTIDLTGLSNPAAMFFMDYNDIGAGGDLAVLEVSTDGGATFAPVQTWDADFRGPLQVTVPIPGAGENDVQVRWHYVNGTFDWWWEIDDLMVTGCTAAPVPSIDLVKTVGTVAGACAATQTIDVPVGTPVTYCYTVTNTGTVALDTHTLVDDQLGVILQNEPIALPPGGSTFVTVDDVLLDATTVNVATWTASGGAPIVTSACGPAISTTGGIATPYPSTLAIAGAPASASTVRVQLAGLTHTYPDDIDLLLVGPGGQSFIMFSDAGGFGPGVSGLDLTLDDAAAGLLPDDTPPVSGSYQPSNYDQQGDAWPPPAPAPPYGSAAPTGTDTFASIFGGSDPNGTWSLYWTDPFLGADDGSITGWCLDALSQTDTASDTDTATVNVLFPDIAVTPASLASTLDPGQTETQPLSIQNTGTADLHWTVEEAPPPSLRRDDDRVQPVRRTRGESGHSLQSAMDDRHTAPPPALVPAGHQLALGDGAFLNQLPNQVNGLFNDATCALCPTGQQSIAENFSLPAAAAIGQVTFWTGYFPGNTATTDDHLTVIFHSDAGGLPGAVVYTESDVAYSRVQTGVILFGVNEWETTLTLASVVNLTPGIYWLEIFNNTVAGGSPDDAFWETGNPDTVGNGLPGSGWSTATPGGPWNFDPATDLAVQLDGPSGPCAAPSDLPWVSAAPNSGTTAPGLTDTVDVTFDATGLTAGTYDGFLCVASDDPDEGLVEVPVTLTVNLIDEMPFLDGFETGDTSRWSWTAP